MEKQKNKPKAKLKGANGNIFCLIGIAQEALKKDGKKEKAEELYERIKNNALDYDHALRIIQEYVEVY